jgi:hypothetical protein
MTNMYVYHASCVGLPYSVVAPRFFGLTRKALVYHLLQVHVIYFSDKGGSSSTTVLDGTCGSGSVGGTGILEVGGISMSNSSHVVVALGNRFQPLDSNTEVKVHVHVQSGD